MHLLEKLQEVGSALRKVPEDAKPLRQLQRVVNSLQYESEDEDLRFLSYFLYVFIDDYFYNIAGDSPFPKKLEHELLTEIGGLLTKMARAFSEKEPVACYGTCRSLAISYLHYMLSAQRSIKS